MEWLSFGQVPVLGLGIDRGVFNDISPVFASSEMYDRDELLGCTANEKDCRAIWQAKNENSRDQFL